MKNSIVFKKWVLKGFAFSFAVAPVAIVVACHRTGKVDLVPIEVQADNLAAITVSGDTKNVTFDIPTELTNIDATNTLSPDGATKAFDVYVRANITVGGTDLPINTSFMPAKLLEAYLGGNLVWRGSNLLIKNDTGEIGVQQTYGGVFGLNPQNVNIVNANTIPGEWIISLKAKYQPIGAYTASKSELSKIIDLDVASLKTFVTLDTAFEKSPSELAALSTKFGYAATSTNDNVTWSPSAITVADLPSAWATYVADLKYSSAAPSSPTKTWQDARPTSFAPAPTNRNLLMQLVPESNYVLSLAYYDLTTISKIRDLSLKIDTLPEFATLDLTKVVMRASNGALQIDESQVTLPVGTKLTYQIGNGGFFAANTFIAEVKKQTALNLSDIKVHLEVTDTARYQLTDDKITKPDVSAILGFASTADFFAAAANLKVNIATSKPTALVWENTPTPTPALSAATTRVEYLAGDYATEALAAAASGWSTTLPTSLNPSWKDYNLWVRVVPRPNYLINSMYADLSATSQMKLVIPDTDISPLVSIANSLVANIQTSLHNSVKWSNSVTVPTSIVSAVKSIEFASGDYADETALAAASWSPSLPNVVDFDSAKRNLWMRVNPNDGFKFAQRTFNLTTTSKVRDILSSVDTQNGFSAINLSSVRMEGSVDNAAVLDNAVVLPTGVKITYSLRTSGWLDKADFINFLKNNQSSLTGTDFAQIQARLDVTDAKKYAITDRKLASPDTSKLTISASSLPAALLTLLNNIKVDQATSFHDNLKWTGLPTNSSLPASVASLSFIGGDNYASKAQVTSAAEAAWQATPPTSTSEVHANRNVWVRINAATGYSFADPYFSLTLGSGIQAVKTNVSTQGVNLSAITISGDYNALVLNNNGVVAPTGTAIYFQYKNGTWGTFAELQAQVTATANLSAQDIATIRVRLQATTQLFAITDDRTATPNTSSVRLTIAPPLAFTNYINSIRVANTATHDALAFDPAPWTKPASITSVSFALGNYNDVASVQASGVTWVDQLSQLQSTSYTHSERHLWARINAATGYNFDTRYFDITSSSNIQSVKSKVDTTSGYSAINLSTITLTGSYSNLTFNSSSITIPTGARLAYQFKGGSWVDATTLQSQINALATVTPADIATIRVKFEPVSAIYAIVNDRAATPNVSGVTITTSLPAAVTTYLQNIKANLTTSTNAAVVWPSLGALPTGVQSITYVSGDYATEGAVTALASSAWQSALPTTVSYIHNSRHLWAKVTPSSGYVFSNNIVDMTSSSDIQKVLSRLNDSPQYAAVDLSRITVSGTINSYTFSESAVTPPSGSRITYSVKTSGWVTLTQLQQYLTTNKSTITHTDINSIKARLEVDPASSSLYTLATSFNKEATITGTVTDVSVADYLQNAVKATGKHNAVVWTIDSSYDFTNSPNIESFSFLYIEGTDASPTVTQAQAEASSGWVSSGLPTSVNPKSTLRNLWARINPKSGQTVAQRYVNITDGSGVRKVPTDLVAQYPDEFSGFAFNYAAITGTKQSVSFEYMANKPLPTGTVLRWSVVDTRAGQTNKSFTNQADFLAFIRTLDWQLEAQSLGFTLELAPNPATAGENATLSPGNYSVKMNTLTYTG